MDYGSDHNTTIQRTMKVVSPRLYLGTMTFGWSQTSSIVDENVALEMTKKFIDFERKSNSAKFHIDTARIYSGGKTEPIVGGVLKSLDSSDVDSILLCTKAHPSQPNGLSPKGIMGQIEESFAAMNINNVGEYYLHQPDTANSLLDSLKCIDGLIAKGTIKSLGMSNYHVSEVKRAFELCDEHGLAKPTVYQGLYNPLNRAIEKELLPLLRENGCSFVAYNPLAAGLLTGKHTSQTNVMNGRFKDNPNYLPRFYTSENFEAIKSIQKACDEENISLIEATFRWLLQYSALGGNDGILLGASSISQLEQNLEACSLTPDEKILSPSVLKAFDEAWKRTESGAFPYWRSYSADMPGREALDQGASYSASKK